MFCFLASDNTSYTSATCLYFLSAYSLFSGFECSLCLVFIFRIFIWLPLQRQFLICFFNSLKGLRHVSAHLEHHSSPPCFDRLLKRSLISGFRVIYVGPRMQEPMPGRRRNRAWPGSSLGSCTAMPVFLRTYSQMPWSLCMISHLAENCTLPVSQTS